MRPVTIAGRVLRPGGPVLVIAEAGVNHNGSVELARRLVDVAVEAGADVVKFQTFMAERVVTPTAPKADYQLVTTDQAESQLAMLRRLELSWEAHRTLFAYCRARGIVFLSTPFDEASADFLDELGVCAFKIPSGEVTNLPFLAHVARKGKPLLLSTGMSSLAEVETAVRTITASGNRELVVLHCVSCYPADPADANLLAMDTLQEAFDVPVGYSDHTPGIAVALAAAARGACVVEKHVTLDKQLPGPDQRASIDPEELRALVQGIRTVHAALGSGRKEPTPQERKTAAVARRSLVTAQPLAAGTRLTEELIAIKRPGTGLAPALRPQVIGKTVRWDLPAGTVLAWEMLSEA